MRTQLSIVSAVMVAVMLLLITSCGHNDEVDALKEENAKLKSELQELKSATEADSSEEVVNETSDEPEKNTSIRETEEKSVDMEKKNSSMGPFLNKQVLEFGEFYLLIPEGWIVNDERNLVAVVKNGEATGAYILLTDADNSSHKEGVKYYKDHLDQFTEGINRGFNDTKDVVSEYIEYNGFPMVKAEMIWTNNGEDYYGEVEFVDNLGGSIVYQICYFEPIDSVSKSKEDYETILNGIQRKGEYSRNEINIVSSLNALRGKNLTKTIGAIDRLDIDATYYYSEYGALKYKKLISNNEIDDYASNKKTNYLINKVANIGFPMEKETGKVTVDIYFAEEEYYDAFGDGNNQTMSTPTPTAPTPTTPTPKAKKKPSSSSQEPVKTLDIDSVWYELQSLGESMYPYGFKIHFLSTSEIQSGDSWVFTCKVTVTNAFGAKRDTFLYATVSSSGSIMSFDVY